MKSLKHTIILSGISILLALATVAPVSAHVVVRPNEAKTASFTSFSVQVPNERELATTEVRLLLPEGLRYVTPNVKQGWTVSTDAPDSADAHEGAVVRTIVWSGGEIPVGQRDDFAFSAKMPDEAGELIWKAYQTYADGTVVAWDLSESQQPKDADGRADFSSSGPYSLTRVVAETADEQALAAATAKAADAERAARRATFLAVAAVIVSITAVAVATRQHGKRSK